MIEILQGKELRMENVLSVRKEMSQIQVNEELMKIRKFFEANGIKKNGSIVTTTFAIENSNGQPIMDMEILVPMDKKIDLTGEYRLKEVFHLKNAVYARHTGNPNNLQATFNEVKEFIHTKELTTITSGYTVMVTETVNSLDEMIMDVYIGVSSNLL